MININLPSSSGGLNLRDPLDNMQPNDCVQMDNIIPENDSDRVRPGFLKRIDKKGNHLISHSVVGQERLIIANGGEVFIYDVSNWELLGTSSVFNSDDWVYTPFVDGAGTPHTIMANGVNIPQDYTGGSTISDIGFTIPTDVKLDNPLSFKNRLYFTGGDWDIYYGEVQSIAGTLTKFSVGSFFRRGGKILTIQNWSQDAGNGVDDLFVIISTEGEILIYSGTNPEAENWALRGTFSIVRPVTKRCCERFGADIIIITEQGYHALSTVLSELRANKNAFSNKLAQITAGKPFNKNWTIKFYSSAGWLFINSPSSITGYNYEQHVLNVNTNSWCRFVGMDAFDWAILFNRLFFVNAKGVFEANVGYTDNGQAITYYKQQAYYTFGTPMKKQLIRITPHYGTIGEDVMYKRIDVDFKNYNNRLLKTDTGTTNNTYWDEAIWDKSYWSDEYKVYTFRGSIVSKAGSYISLGYYGKTKSPLNFYSTGCILRQGYGHI